MQIFSIIIGLCKSVPIIDKWLERLFIAYQVHKKEQIRAETIKEVNDGISNQDQRKIEDDAHSGKPSGLGVIRDSLPGLGMRDKKPD